MFICIVGTWPSSELFTIYRNKWFDWHPYFNFGEFNFIPLYELNAFLSVSFVEFQFERFFFVCFVRYCAIFVEFCISINIWSLNYAKQDWFVINFNGSSAISIFLIGCTEKKAKKMKQKFARKKNVNEFHLCFKMEMNMLFGINV